MRTLFVFIILTFSVISNAQINVSGKVLDNSNKIETAALQSAAIYALRSAVGVYTDSLGQFTLNLTALPDTLVVSFIGYLSDTLLIKESSKNLNIKLKPTASLKEVEIESKQSSIKISTINPINKQVITQKELQKAACCNLSESFETNPSVDVSFADAVTGLKQIQLLGLSGSYAPVTTEWVPLNRGLGALNGITFLPGPWMESIQVTKGIGPVTTGFESISGQINAELKKPDNSEKLFFNSYLNSMGRQEINLTSSHKLNEKTSTGIFLHANQMNKSPDMNMDGFADMPSGNQINIMNRWKYMNNGWIVQTAGRYIKDYRLGAQSASLKETIHNHDSLKYEFNNSIERGEAYLKSGYVFKNNPNNSIAIIASAFTHNQQTLFGISNYSGKENFMNATLLWQSIIKNTNHKYKAGISFTNDKYDEKFKLIPFARIENIVGAYYEYTYSSNARFDLIAGIRSDYHSIFGWIVTPRVHAKYNFTEKFIARFSAGRGQRTANIFAENTSVFVSSRKVNIIPSSSGRTVYGLKPEQAWNAGINLTKEFKLNYREGSIVIDYYYTHFTNNVVIDFDKSPHAIYFYNSTAKAYSSSFQAELNYEPIKRLDVRMAYRRLDVKNTYFGKLLSKPYISSDRVFFNLAYATKNKFVFDYTLNWNSRKRLPNTSSNPEAFRLPDYSPEFYLMNVQMSKTFFKEEKLNVYIGCENLTDFKQTNLVLSPQNPFSSYFDASMVWGPVIGRMFYAGLKFKI